jgi:hypothetical protein
MKMFEITIEGYGGEICIGELNKKEKKLIQKNLEKEDLGEFIWNEGLGSSWYNFDNIYHGTGCFRDSMTLTVKDEDGNLLYEISENFSAVPVKGKKRSFANIEEENDYYHLCSDEKPALMCVSLEKGQFFKGIVEDKDFDIKKLQICFDTNLSMPNGEVYELVSNISYDEETLENISGDTDGKGFRAYVNF